MVDDYNHNVGGCDLMDKCVSYNGVFQRKSRKWWKKVFHWVLEVAQINALVLYKLTQPVGEKPISIQKFKDKLVTNTAGDHPNTAEDDCRLNFYAVLDTVISCFKDRFMQDDYEMFFTLE